MFSYDKCNLNTDLPAVPRFRIDYFCLNKDSAVSSWCISPASH